LGQNGQVTLALALALTLALPCVAAAALLWCWGDELGIAGVCCCICCVLRLQPPAPARQTMPTHSPKVIRMAARMVRSIPADDHRRQLISSPTPGMSQSLGVAFVSY